MPASVHVASLKLCQRAEPLVSPHLVHVAAVVHVAGEKLCFAQHPHIITASTRAKKIAADFFHIIPLSINFGIYMKNYSRFNDHGQDKDHLIELFWQVIL